MNAFIVIAGVALVLVAATALGQFWAPLLLGLGFGVWGALLLTSGFGALVPLAGAAFVGAGLLELAAAGVLFGEHDAGRRDAWRLGATLLGLTGTAGGLASLAWIAAAATAALFI